MSYKGSEIAMQPCPLVLSRGHRSSGKVEIDDRKEPNPRPAAAKAANRL